jgi:hypothetical protein
MLSSLALILAVNANLHVMYPITAISWSGLTLGALASGAHEDEAEPAGVPDAEEEKASQPDAEHDAAEDREEPSAPEPSKRQTRQLRREPEQAEKPAPKTRAGRRTRQASKAAEAEEAEVGGDAEQMLPAEQSPAAVADAQPPEKKARGKGQLGAGGLAQPEVPEEGKTPPPAAAPAVTDGAQGRRTTRKPSARAVAVTPAGKPILPALPPRTTRRMAAAARVQHRFVNLPAHIIVGLMI